MAVDIVKRLRKHASHGYLIGDEAAEEIERLRSDLVLLGPVTTPLSGQDCASCGRPCCADWTYCPSCGAQERVEGAISPHQKRKG
jgi:hypothetical protein